MKSLSEQQQTELLRLREQLAAFRTAACGLVHEEVMELMDDGVNAGSDPADVPVRRRGLCTAQTRRNILGCAHTSANGIFSDLADEVYRMGILGDGPLPSSFLRPTALHIYQLDHAKGGLEKQLALAKHHGDIAGSTSIRQEINGILAGHAQYIRQIESFRKNLLARIDEHL